MALYAILCCKSQKFLNFVREKVKDFNPPINDLEAWLAGTNGAGKERSCVYYDMFQIERENWRDYVQKKRLALVFKDSDRTLNPTILQINRRPRQTYGLVLVSQHRQLNLFGKVNRQGTTEVNSSIGISSL
jgi:hypothetical protein